MAASAQAAVAAPSGSSARRGRGWEINVGALAVGSNGIALKPQCLFGAQVGNFSAEAGLHDVRDGLKVSAQAEAAMSAEATGHSVQELHDNVELDTPGFREALDAAKQFLSKGASQLADVARSLGISSERLGSALAGQVGPAQCTAMTLKVTAEVGVGVSAHVCLGWKDTKGYNMVGVGGKASAAFALRVSAFAGRHKKKQCAKIVLGITNFKFEYTFPIGSLEDQPEAAVPAASAEEEAADDGAEESDDSASRRACPS